MLVKELQSLALDVKVLDRDGEEIELSSLDEELDPPNVVSDVNENDIGEQVMTDDYADSFVEKAEDNIDDDIFSDDEEPDFEPAYDDEDFI